MLLYLPSIQLVPSIPVGLGFNSLNFFKNSVKTVIYKRLFLINIGNMKKKCKLKMPKQ